MKYTERYPGFKFDGPVFSNGKVCVERNGLRYRVFKAPVPTVGYSVMRGTKVRGFLTFEAAMEVAVKLEGK